jgi:hypothetical protein
VLFYWSHQWIAKVIPEGKQHLVASVRDFFYCDINVIAVITLFWAYGQLAIDADSLVEDGSGFSVFIEFLFSALFWIDVLGQFFSCTIPTWGVNICISLLFGVNALKAMSASGDGGADEEGNTTSSGKLTIFAMVMCLLTLPMSLIGVMGRCSDKRTPLADTDKCFGFRMTAWILYYVVCHPYVWLFFYLKAKLTGDYDGSKYGFSAFLQPLAESIVVERGKAIEASGSYHECLKIPCLCCPCQQADPVYMAEWQTKRIQKLRESWVKEDDKEFLKKKKDFLVTAKELRELLREQQL